MKSFSKQTLATTAARIARKQGKHGVTKESALYWIDLIVQASRALHALEPDSEVILDKRSAFILESRKQSKKTKAKKELAESIKTKDQQISSYKTIIKHRIHSIERAIGVKTEASYSAKAVPHLKESIDQVDLKKISLERIFEFKERLRNKQRVIRTEDEEWIEWAAFILHTDTQKLAENLYECETLESLDKYRCPKTGKYPTDKQFRSLDLENFPHKAKRLYDIDPHSGTEYINEYKDNRNRWEKQNPGKTVYAATVTPDLKIVPTLAASIGLKFWAPDTDESLTAVKLEGYPFPERWFYPAAISSPYCFTKIKGKIQEIYDFLPLKE